MENLHVANSQVYERTVEVFFNVFIQIKNKLLLIACGISLVLRMQKLYSHRPVVVYFHLFKPKTNNFLSTRGKDSQIIHFRNYLKKRLFLDQNLKKFEIWSNFVTLKANIYETMHL